MKKTLLLAALVLAGTAVFATPGKKKKKEKAQQEQTQDAHTRTGPVSYL